MNLLRKSFRLALLGLAMFPAGCGPSAESVEASSALRAIDALRDAPSDPLEDRKKLLDALARQVYSTPRALAARDACVRAYRALLDGRALEARVRSALSKPSTLDPSILRDLATAEEKIKESELAMPDCNNAVAMLRLSVR